MTSTTQTDLLDSSYFHTLFFYSDGALFWKRRPIDHFSSIHYCNRWNSRMAGKAAGANNHGYVMIRIRRKTFMAHRIIFCMFYGYMPDNIDHINMNRSDNRPNNLRAATVAENNRNRKAQKNSLTGIKGVSINKTTGKYQARIGFDKKYYQLGSFNTPELASMAYQKAAEEFHGKFARNN
jgi:hypothetical protein